MAEPRQSPPNPKKGPACIRLAGPTHVRRDVLEETVPILSSAPQPPNQAILLSICAATVRHSPAHIAYR
jgi:hypothetical protein